MTIDYDRLRLDGVYRQNDEGKLMLRAKIPAGVLSSEQALKIAGIADRHAGGRVHLTTRGSIEFHDLDHGDLPDVARGLAAVGLTSRGACGGAVRGISCSSTLGESFPIAEALVRRLHRHFAGNPYFEGLPKKFKIGVDGDYSRSRHLIQDAGLVHAGYDGEEALYDVWMAGGLGREPQAAFLFERRVPESRLLPLLEATISVFRDHGEPHRRLKHLLNRVGEAELRRLITEAAGRPPGRPIDNGLGQTLSARPSSRPIPPVTVPVFAGELPSHELRVLAELADRHACGALALTADQDIALFPADRAAADILQAELTAAELTGDPVIFRICPGSHECRMGLAPTRDIARQLLERLSPDQRQATWAISGCSNSCSQPQLAAFGILARKLVRDENGARAPRFDLLCRTGEGLGEAVATDLELNQLLARIAATDEAP